MPKYKSCHVIPPLRTPQGAFIITLREILKLFIQAIALYDLACGACFSPCLPHWLDFLFFVHVSSHSYFRTFALAVSLPANTCLQDLSMDGSFLLFRGQLKCHLCRNLLWRPYLMTLTNPLLNSLFCPMPSFISFIMLTAIGYFIVCLFFSLFIMFLPWLEYKLREERVCLMYYRQYISTVDKYSPQPRALPSVHFQNVCLEH